MHSTDIDPAHTGKETTPDHLMQTVGLLVDKVLGRMRDKGAFNKNPRYRIVLRVEEIED